MAKAPNPAHKYNFVDNIKQTMVGEWYGSKMLPILLERPAGDQNSSK